MADATQESFEELLDLYPLDFVIPQKIRDELLRKGIAVSVHGDKRMAPRFRTNGSAIMSWISSPEAMPQPQPTRQVVVRDLSKTGVCILTSSEWYPEQVCRMQFAVGEMTARVMRARRLGQRCFEIGLRVIKFDRNDGE